MLLSWFGWTGMYAVIPKVVETLRMRPSLYPVSAAKLFRPDRHLLQDSDEWVPVASASVSRLASHDEATMVYYHVSPGSAGPGRLPRLVVRQRASVSTGLNGNRPLGSW